MAWKVERGSRPVWHCPGLMRNGPGDPFYMGRRMREDSLRCWRAGSVESNPIGVNRCFSSDILVGCSRRLQPQVDGICVPIWLDHEWHEFHEWVNGGKTGKTPSPIHSSAAFFREAMRPS